MKSVTLFVEGGGDQNELGAKCRRGSRSFLEKAGQAGNMPRILPCGSRNNAFARYCEAVLKRQKALLPVDSESSVHEYCEKGAPKERLPWRHLKNGSGDGWNKPRVGRERRLPFFGRVHGMLDPVASMRFVLPRQHAISSLEAWNGQVSNLRDLAISISR